VITDSLELLHQALISKGALPPYGLQRRKLRYILELSQKGACLGVTDYGSVDMKMIKGPCFTVPIAVKRATCINPNLLWDNCEYVLGVGHSRSNFKNCREVVAQRHLAFLKKLKRFSLTVEDDDGINAILAFYSRGNYRDHTLTAWIAENGDGASATVSFKLQGDRCIIAERESVRNAITTIWHNLEIHRTQTIKTDSNKPVRMHRLLKGLPGGNASKTTLAPFNISKGGIYATTPSRMTVTDLPALPPYLTAVDWLLSASNQRSFQLGRLTLLCWNEGSMSEEEARVVENTIHGKGAPEPNRKREATAEQSLSSKSFAAGIRIAGRRPEVCLLGLVANASRATPVFFRRQSSLDLYENIDAWNRELKLNCGGLPVKGTILSLANLVQALTIPGEENGHHQTQMAISLVQAAIFGEKIWDNILTVAVGLLKRHPPEKDGFVLCAVIKVALVRNYNIPLPYDLHTTIEDVPYRLGRLFAVLEYLDALAAPQLMRTLRRRFWTSASTWPSKGFRIPLQMSGAYLRKLSPRAWAFFENALDRLVSEIPIASLPPKLCLADQGLFAIGYYHQMAELSESPFRISSATLDSALQDNGRGARDEGLSRGRSVFRHHERSHG
jgi:CRISPR-associated protein Csd1